MNQASNTNPIIQFCNTLFENVQNGIVSTSNQYSTNSSCLYVLLGGPMYIL